MDSLARVFKALGDPTRLRIVNLLARRPWCVCEIQAVLALPQPLLSRHLAYLRSAGLVTSRRAGMRVRYSLASGTPLLRSLLRVLQQGLERDRLGRRDLRRARAVAARNA
jgi:ArsR family transcriptional regulator